MKLIADPASVVAAFVDAMRQAGIDALDPIEGKLIKGGPIYFRTQHDKNHQRRGWAVLHLDGRPAGAFGHFKSMQRQNWRYEGRIEHSRLATRKLAKLASEHRSFRGMEMIARQEAVAALCQRRWQSARAVKHSHPYLASKRITGECLRQTGEHLLVPMHDEHGVLWNLQSIAPDGTKRFAKGARQKGLHLVLGKIADTLTVSEGYGTAAVIRRATGLPSVAAFSAGNLMATARTLRTVFPNADIIIGADDDAHLVSHPQIGRNLGLEAAYAAARAVGGRVAEPSRRAA